MTGEWNWSSATSVATTACISVKRSRSCTVERDVIDVPSRSCLRNIISVEVREENQHVVVHSSVVAGEVVTYCLPTLNACCVLLDKCTGYGTLDLHHHVLTSSRSVNVRCDGGVTF